MEKQLVSFGNYLLKKCKVKGYSLDGEPVLERMVTDSDISNWKDVKSLDSLSSYTSLMSRYAINDKVKLNFFSAGIIDNCRIIKIHFTESKVLYDVEIEMLIPIPPIGGTETTEYSTRLYNIDSSFVIDKD